MALLQRGLINPTLSVYLCPYCNWTKPPAARSFGPGLMCVGICLDLDQQQTFWRQQWMQWPALEMQCYTTTGCCTVASLIHVKLFSVICSRYAPDMRVWPMTSLLHHF